MLIGPQTKLDLGVFKGEEVSYPTTAAGFLASTGVTPSALYTCQIASGALVDVVGGNNLAAAGSPRYQRSVAGSVGVSYDAASTAGHAGAAVNEPGLASFIIGAIATHPTRFAASLPGIIGKSSSTTLPICAIYRASDAVNHANMLIKGATTGSLLLGDVAINVVSPIRPILYLGQIDRTAAIARFLVADADKVLTLQSGSIAGFDTFTGGTAPNFFTGAGNSAVFAGGAALSLGFYATGAQCEGTNTLLNIAKRLGFGE